MEAKTIRGMIWLVTSMVSCIDEVEVDRPRTRDGWSMTALGRSMDLEVSLLPISVYTHGAVACAILAFTFRYVFLVFDLHTLCLT